MANLVKKICTEDGTKTIGGAQFDDTWVTKYTVLGTKITISAGGTKTISLSSYLPNNNYDYYVQIHVELTTGTTAGDTIDGQVFSGSNATGFSCRAGRQLTRTSNTEISAQTVEIPISASDKAITIKNVDGNGTGTYIVSAHAYRRIGTNGKQNNYIQKIQIPKNETLVVGGDILDGGVVQSTRTLLSGGSIAGGTTKTISLSSYLPSDGYDYECYFNLTAHSPATSGTAISMRLNSGSSADTSSPIIGRVISRSEASRVCAGNYNCVIKSTDRNITIYNSGGHTAYNISLYLRGYRRIGKNQLGSQDYISNINDISIGGAIADGQWVYKFYTIFRAHKFPAITSNTTYEYTVSNYLPTSGVYQVLFQTYSRTGVTSGNPCTWWVRGNNRNMPQVASYINTRTASNQCDAKSGILFCNQNSKGDFTVFVDVTSKPLSGNCGLYLVGYRKIGSNA